MQTLQINQDYTAANGVTVQIVGSMAISRDGTRTADVQWVTPTQSLDINVYGGVIVVPGKGQAQCPADLLADLRSMLDSLALSAEDQAADAAWAAKEAKLARNMARSGF
jgi:hypothetical protein